MGLAFLIAKPLHPKQEQVVNEPKPVAVIPVTVVKEVKKRKPRTPTLVLS